MTGKKRMCLNSFKLKTIIVLYHCHISVGANYQTHQKLSNTFEYVADWFLLTHLHEEIQKMTDSLFMHNVYTFKKTWIEL